MRSTRGAELFTAKRISVSLLKSLFREVKHATYVRLMSCEICIYGGRWKNMQDRTQIVEVVGYK